MAVVRTIALVLGTVAAVLPRTGAVSSFALPLHVSGRHIVDSNAARVKLGCLNWYGLDQKDFVVGGLNFRSLADIAGDIAGWGFNCIRLPWSVQLVAQNPALDNRTVTAEPSLMGKRGMDAFDATVAALDAAGLMIILDNHMSTGGCGVCTHALDRVHTRAHALRRRLVLLHVRWQWAVVHGRF